LLGCASLRQKLVSFLHGRAQQTVNQIDVATLPTFAETDPIGRAAANEVFFVRWLGNETPTIRGCRGHRPTPGGKRHYPGSPKFGIRWPLLVNLQDRENAQRDPALGGPADSHFSSLPPLILDSL